MRLYIIQIRIYAYMYINSIQIEAFMLFKGLCFKICAI